MGENLGDYKEEEAPPSLQIPRTPANFDFEAISKALIPMIDAAKQGKPLHPYCVCSFFPLESLISNVLTGNLFPNVSMSSSSIRIAKILTRYLYEETIRIFNQS